MFRDHSRWQRRFLAKRRPAGDHLKLHDGGHHHEPSVHGHAGKGGEAAAPGVPVCTVGIIFVGYSFNLFQYLFV